MRKAQKSLCSTPLFSQPSMAVLLSIRRFHFDLLSSLPSLFVVCWEGRLKKKVKITTDVSLTNEFKANNSLFSLEVFAVCLCLPLPVPLMNFMYRSEGELNEMNADRTCKKKLDWARYPNPNLLPYLFLSKSFQRCFVFDLQEASLSNSLFSAINQTLCLNVD